jgi:aerobic-type carbon monoxide dehydrogenase small subunit (CoxS/CutS family)
MLTTLMQLLEEHPDPSEEMLREELSGNLCRCTGYAGIIRAALKAAPLLKAWKDEAGRGVSARESAA